MKLTVRSNALFEKQHFHISSAILFVVFQAYGLKPVGLGKESIQSFAVGRFEIDGDDNDGAWMGIDI